MAHLAHLTDGKFHNGGSSAGSLAGIIGAGMRMDWWCWRWRGRSGRWRWLGIKACAGQGSTDRTPALRMIGGGLFPTTAWMLLQKQERLHVSPASVEGVALIARDPCMISLGSCELECELKWWAVHDANHGSFLTIIHTDRVRTWTLVRGEGRGNYPRQWKSIKSPLS